MDSRLLMTWWGEGHIQTRDDELEVPDMVAWSGTVRVTRLGNPGHLKKSSELQFLSCHFMNNS